MKISDFVGKIVKEVSIEQRVEGSILITFTDGSRIYTNDPDNIFFTPEGDNATDDIKRSSPAEFWEKLS